MYVDRRFVRYSRLFGCVCECGFLCGLIVFSLPTAHTVTTTTQELTKHHKRGRGRAGHRPSLLLVPRRCVCLGRRAGRRGAVTRREGALGVVWAVFVRRFGGVKTRALIEFSTPGALSTAKRRGPWARIRRSFLFAMFSKIELMPRL